MDLTWLISLYFVIWWTCLFAVLPWGAKSHHEAGIEVPGGGDPASPVNPNLKKKFLTTTWVAAIVTAVVWSVFHFGLLPLPNLPWGPGTFY
jgi:predicted secreted protein